MIEVILILIAIVVASFLLGWSIATNRELDEKIALMELVIKQDEVIKRTKEMLKEKLGDERKD